MNQLSLTLFGGFAAAIGNSTSIHFATDKARALLAYLMLAADAPLRREALAGLLWPEQPEDLARQNLRQTLLRLRKSLERAQPGLGAALLTMTRQTVELHSEYGQADAGRFWQHNAAVATHQHADLAECSACLVRLEAAADLYRQGDFLAGLSLPDAPPFEEWLLLERERLYQQQLTALEQLADAYERQGAFDAAYRYALWQLAQEPWREGAHRQLMRLLAGGGRRAEALAQYENCRQVLADELGIEPGAETQALWQQIHDEAFQPAGQRHMATHHLPRELTPFVGREAELAYILTTLNDATCRVLTLVGPGGSGKTRLSIQIGRLLEAGDGAGPRYRDGAYFLSLAQVNQADTLVTAIAQALGLQLTEQITPRQQLLSFLHDRQLLLIGDNFEQIQDGAALVAAIAAAAPGVQWLLTSQQPLNIQAEWRYTIGGLTYEDGGESAAVQFFVRCARRAAPGFRLRPEDGPVVTELCRLLDGLPLALEIAAGWVRLMDCAAILRETRRNLDFLVSPLGDLPARHQSVRAVLSYSWDLLPPNLQATLYWIAQFAGTFTLEAALAVLPGQPGHAHLLTDMAALLDKSLVQWRPDGHYQLHALLRKFVRQQPPADAAAVREFRRRFCAYYFNLVAGQETTLRGQDPQPAIATIQDQLNNIRLAWAWALEERFAGSLGAALSSLGRFYHLVGLFEEAEQQLLAALPRAADWPGAAEGVADLRLQLHLQTAHFLGHSGQYTQAIAQARQAQMLAEQSGSTGRLAQALSLEGEWQRYLNRLDQARECLTKAAASFANPSRSWDYAHTLNQIGQLHLIQSQYDAALAAFGQARQIYQAVGDRTEMIMTLGYMAEAYRMKADYALALEYGRQALTVAESIGYKQAMVRSAIVLGSVQLDQGNVDLARETLQRALAVAQAIGYLPGIIQSRCQLGATYVTQGQFDEADQLFQLARLQADELGLHDLVAQVVGRQGVVHAHRGDHEAAIDAYRQAAQLWRLLDNQTELGRNLSNLGNIFLRQGEYERALDYYERALSAVQSVGARQWAANIFVRLGNVYKRMGNYQRAVASIEQALDLHRVLQHKPGIVTSLAWLGLMRQEMGEFVAARALHEEAMALAQEIGDPINVTVCLNNLADIDLQLGRGEQAEALVQRSVELARTLGNSRYLPGALMHQAEILFHNGRHEAARLVLAEVMPLSESLGDQQMAFTGRLLQAQLLAQEGDPALALARLQEMTAQFSGDEYQAELYYHQWRFSGDPAARQAALPLYERLLAAAPNIKRQRQWQALQAGKKEPLA